MKVIVLVTITFISYSVFTETDIEYVCFNQSSGGGVVPDPSLSTGSNCTNPVVSSMASGTHDAKKSTMRSPANT